MIKSFSLFLSLPPSLSIESGHSLLHMATHVLPSVYSLNINNDTLSYIDLFNHLPSGRGPGHPLLSLTALDPLNGGPHGGKILIHEGFVSYTCLHGPVVTKIHVPHCI